MDQITSEHITSARQYYSNGSYSNAFELYIEAFEDSPQLKARCEQEFRVLLTKFNELLASAGKMGEIFSNFGCAIGAYPDNIFILNDIGKYLYKYGFYTEAFCHFQKALKLDVGFVNAEKNLNSVKNFLVERWHFRMLNDKIRNDAYHEAIRETLKPFKDSILDLGTGTGLLAIYANEFCPTATTGCDGSETMTKLAECILQENGIQVVVIVNKLSDQMNYRDIGGKRSLLITEMFDAGLFGENILQALSHAREHLLTNNARILPNKAEFFVAGAKCDPLFLKYQLGAKAKTLLKIPSVNAHVITKEETYDCEDVHLFKDLKYMTAPQSLFTIDFNDHNDVQDKLNGTEPYSVELKAIENGEINTVIGWFHLYLTESITITTDPRSDNRANAWQQAVFFDNVPQTVKDSETINAQFLINGGKLTMVPNFDGLVMRTSPELLRFLNDAEYIKMINNCIGISCVYLGQLCEMCQTTIVDLCPFPYFGLLMLKRGAQSVVCCAKTHSDKKFFKKVFKANKIPMAKVKIIIGEDWDKSVFHDQKYHVVFTNIFELCGDIDLRMKQIAQHLKNAHLVQGGLCMPANVAMMAQLVSSRWLDINNRLDDKNVGTYKMATHVNKYQVSQNFCLNFSTLEYTALTEPACLGRCSSGISAEVIDVPVTEDGEANAILCWYIIEVMEDLGEISTKRGNCFIDGMAFLANPPVPLVQGGVANILRCVDSDGSFKLMTDSEAE